MKAGADALSTAELTAAPELGYNFLCAGQLLDAIPDCGVRLDRANG